MPLSKEDKLARKEERISKLVDMIFKQEERIEKAEREFMTKIGLLKSDLRRLKGELHDARVIRDIVFDKNEEDE